MFIHLLKRTWKNGWVKWNLFKKSSLNFIFGQGDSRKSDFARPKSGKPLLFENFRDLRLSHIEWQFCVTIQYLWLLNFKDRPSNFSTCRISVWDKSECFCSFFICRSFFNVVGFLDSFWGVTSSFCSMSRAAGWSLLKKDY